MATATQQGVTLQLTPQEAEDLHGLLRSQIAGQVTQALSAVANALAVAGVGATVFAARPRNWHPNDGVILLDERADVEVF